MNIDDLLQTVQTSHGNSQAFRSAIRELRQLDDATAEPMGEGFFNQTVSMLRHKRTGQKCREGCLRSLRAIVVQQAAGGAE